MTYYNADWILYIEEKEHSMLLFAIFLQVMDKHLNILAKQHIETRFVKLNAEKSPFLAEKLKIIVLPTLALSLSGSLFFFGRY